MLCRIRILNFISFFAILRYITRKQRPGRNREPRKKVMHAIKDRVSENLSRLFSDSPSQNPDQQPEAPRIKEGKSWSSTLSFVLPSLSFDRFRTNNHQNDLISHQSHSFRWRSKSFSLKDIPLDRRAEYDHDYGINATRRSCEEDADHGSISKLDSEKKLSTTILVDNGDSGSGRSTNSDYDVFEDATDRNSFEKSMPNLTDDSLFISPVLYDFLESSLPNIVKGCQWILLYSTVKHGISLRTLIRRTANLSGPCLLIASDKQGAIFGGLLDCPLTPTPKRKYQGTNQTFVFTTLYGEPRLFRPTGANRFFYMCLNDLLALGGGANFALCLDADLLIGTSGPSETFANLCLAHNQEFELKNVELWGFTHASRYLT